MILSQRNGYISGMIPVYMQKKRVRMSIEEIALCHIIC